MLLGAKIIDYCENNETHTNMLILRTPNVEFGMLVYKIAIILKVLIYTVLYVQCKCSSRVLTVSYIEINAVI
jgi:hypothetical protein